MAYVVGDALMVRAGLVAVFILVLFGVAAAVIMWAKKRPEDDGGTFDASKPAETPTAVRDTGKVEEMWDHHDTGEFGKVRDVPVPQIPGGGVAPELALHDAPLTPPHEGARAAQPVRVTPPNPTAPQVPPAAPNPAHPPMPTISSPDGDGWDDTLPPLPPLSDPS